MRFTSEGFSHMNEYPENVIIQPFVANALKGLQPVVALESAVITHGLPQPENLSIALELQAIIRNEGAVPATIAVLDGVVHIGLEDSELERLANLQISRKISRRDFGYAAMKKLSGGTTVAGTMTAANLVGIKVFATGGIGGVHRESHFDISADLEELGRTPMIVVCAGAKAILDISATMEVLETHGVLVAGYQAKELPAFYSRSSGMTLDTWFNTPEEIASTARSQWKLGVQSSLLIVQPPPVEYEIPSNEIEECIRSAISDAKILGVHGPAVTPYLLDKMKVLTKGKSLVTNIALLKNNARLAARISIALHQVTGKRI
jgi:pseudouridine-5'-phosphate glycosidase